MRRWLPERIDELFRHRLFTLERHRLAAGPARREAVVLRAPDWVNVIPLLAGGEVVLVRQWRYGTAAPTLEIPGGMVEAESEREAAERELLEETGYRAGAGDGSAMSTEPRLPHEPVRHLARHRSRIGGRARRRRRGGDRGRAPSARRSPS